MNVDDATKYVAPACKNLFGEYTVVAGKKLDDLLGINEYGSYCHREVNLDFPMDGELKRLLVKLAGPHGHTILKAYRIRKGLENDS